MTPTLNTARLVLRSPVYEDFPAYAAFLASDRAWGLGGPLSVDKAWTYFTNDSSQWPLLNMGALMIERHGKPGAIGQVAVCGGPIFPEPELGWFLFDGYEGQGYAQEAAGAIRDWALETRGLTNLVSYIDPANDRSIALATRLGGVLDTAAATPNNAPTSVYRFAPRGTA